MSVPNLVRPDDSVGYGPNGGHHKGDYQKCESNNTHNTILALAVFINNSAYLIYTYLFWVFFKQMALKAVENELVIMPVDNNLVLSTLISFSSTYLWGTFLTQGFEADPFSNIISYNQKQIGRDEMVYKFVGNLFAGIPLGLTFKLVGYHFGYTFNPLRDKIFHAISVGLISVYKSTFTIFFWPWLPNALKRLFINLATLILHPSKTCSFFPFSRNEFKDIHLSLSTLIDVALVEFVASFIVYLAITISMQNSEPKHMWHLINATKRMVTFIGYSILSPIGDGPAYNASVIIGMAISSMDACFLVVKIVSNLSAAILCTKVFKPPKSMSNKAGKPHEWPNSFLGKICHKLELRMNGKNTD